MKKKLCICFAGPVGCSKTPVANYLSWNLGLPVFNSDAVRSEIVEDSTLNNYEKRDFNKVLDKRLHKLTKYQRSFILGVSVDRSWRDVKRELENNAYFWFLISFNLSKNLLTKMYKAKGYKESLNNIDKFIQDHGKFFREYRNDVGFIITDENFSNRLDVCLQESKKVMESHNV
jgi:hypothetical protein